MLLFRLTDLYWQTSWLLLALWKSLIYFYWIWERQASGEYVLGGPLSCLALLHLWYLDLPVAQALWAGILVPRGPSLLVGHFLLSIWVRDYYRLLTNQFIFFCLFIKLEKNFGSWGDGSCCTKTILSLGNGFASVSEVENHISWLSAPCSEKSHIVKVLGIMGHMVSTTAT